jgi:hypothetical protein
MPAGVALLERLEPRIMDDGRQHIDTTRARGGVTGVGNRMTLFVGLGLVVIIFAILVISWA